MVYKIIWSPSAVRTYISNIEYLETLWAEREVLNFINSVKRKIQLLSTNPNLRSPTKKEKILENR